MKNIHHRALLTGIMLLAPLIAGFAVTTGQMTYQARLLDAYDRRVNDKVDLSFKLYDAAENGNLLWMEAHTQVQVVDGIYSVILGSITPIPASTFTQDGIYMELGINNETMLPRQLIASSAQALVARTVVGPDLFVDQNGKVGVGTTSPTEQLDVAGTVKATGFKLPTGATAGYVLTSDGNGTGQWQPTLVTAETDPIFTAWKASTYIPATGELWAAIGTKVDQTLYDTATNDLWAAVDARLKLSGGVMTGPLTNTFGFYGNGAGLTNLNTGILVMSNYVARAGDNMFGPLVLSNSLTVNGKIVATPAAEQILSASSQINAGNLSYVRIKGNAPGIALGNPQILSGTDGQIIILQGNDAINTVMLVNGNGLSLSTGVPFMMGTNDIIQLVYNGGNWVEIHRADK